VPTKPGRRSTPEKFVSFTASRRDEHFRRSRLPPCCVHSRPPSSEQSHHSESADLILTAIHLYTKLQRGDNLLISFFAWDDSLGWLPLMCHII
jgi:hypothetical protein